MTNERKHRIDGVAASILITFNIGLGLNQALVKIVNVGLAPVLQVGLRSACAFVPVLIFAWLTRRRLSITDGSLGFGVLNGLLFCGEFCLLFIALEYTTVARVSLFFYTMPFWVAIVAHVMFPRATHPEEQLTPMRSLGLLIAVTGVALALFSGDGGADEAGPDAWIGDLLAICASMFWAAITLLTRTSRLNRCTPEMNLLYQLAVSAVLLVPLAFLLGDTVRNPTPEIMLVFAFQSLVIVAIGFVVWFWVLSIYPVSNMVSFSLLAPVFGVFFGWLIFADNIGVSFIAALVMVCIGIVLINRRPQAVAAPQTS